MDQNPQDQNLPKDTEINLGEILLPKKDIHSVDSAQRVDAGTLLQQEQSATLPKPATPPTPTPVTPPKPLGESIPPLQTFQGDIANTIQDKGTSVVSIAAAEAERRAGQPVSQDIQLVSTVSNAFRNTIFGILGFMLMAGAAGVIIYALVLKSPFPAQQGDFAPFIAIDGTSKVVVASTTQGRSLMSQLTEAKVSVSLSFGLVSQIYIEREGASADGEPAFVDAQTLLSLIAPGMPPALLRDVSPVYLLGVHSFGVNQPFLILKADSYEQAYAGMLAWEKTMKQELSPLFSNAPAATAVNPAQNSQPSLISASSTSSTSPAVASSTISATTTLVSTSSPEVPPLQTGFTDAIVENHDARVTKDKYGTIDFLWTFLDRRTLVITTNPGTLREIITRLKQAPLITQPSVR